MSLGDITRRIRNAGEKALVAFLTAGYPDDDTFVELVRTAAEAGCDLIEIGVPFSDPIADGPLIQHSSKRALEGGVTLQRCFERAKELAPEIETPLLFMSYYNPILRMGHERFAAQARETGLRGVIVPDVPAEESAPIRAACRECGISYIDLVAPTSSDDRIGRITDGAEGFVYLVAVTGVTGTRSASSADVAHFVRRVRRKTDLPLYVGFGIASPEQAAETARQSDGVIIGSALVRIIEASASKRAAVESVGQFLRQVRSAIQSAGRTT
jgi:tryptophan synthase alpha chain